MREIDKVYNFLLFFFIVSHRLILVEEGDLKYTTINFFSFNFRHSCLSAIDSKKKTTHNFIYIYTHIQKSKGIYISCTFSHYMKYIENNTWARVDMERSERVTCRVKHAKRNSISTCNPVLVCLSYKHNSPLLRKKAGFIND